MNDEQFPGMVIKLNVLNIMKIFSLHLMSLRSGTCVLPLNRIPIIF